MLPFGFKLRGKLEEATCAGLIRGQPALRLLKPPAILALLVVEAVKRMLQP